MTEINIDPTLPLVTSQETNMSTTSTSDPRALLVPKGALGTTPAGGVVTEANGNGLDDSGDDRSRLWRITWWSLAWLAVVLPAAVAFGRITGPQALAFLQWILPVVLTIFGGIKAGQKVAGAALGRKPAAKL